MSGAELYERLRKADPQQAERMIFMSGGACTPEATAFLAGAGRPTIQKPFRTATLREAIRQALTVVHEIG
jgi:FixJ family two-component response regulator